MFNHQSSNAPALVFVRLLTVCTTLWHASAHAAVTVYTHASYETGGVIINIPNSTGDEAATLQIKGPGDSAFKDAHPFVAYDNYNMASSLFNLQPNTLYQLRITVADPDGTPGSSVVNAALQTKAAFTLPAPTRIVTVGPGGNYSTIQNAVNNAQPGDEIRVASGTYGPVDLFTKNGTAQAPIVVRAANPATKPVIDGNNSGTALDFDDSSNIIFDGFEIRNGGSNSAGIGVRIGSSARIAVRNSFIHDNGRYNILVTKGDEYPGGPLAGGFHLIENNVIADTSFGSCSGGSNSACANQTYYGILQDNNPGPGTVIRGNLLYGQVDNAVICGDEGAGRDLYENVDHVLQLTGGAASEGWTNHNVEFYDNESRDARDDDIELDGICVNARVFRNTFGNAQNPFSMAPAQPGPYFVIRNLIKGHWGEAAIKMNTGGNPDNPERNLFFYHNTIVRNTNGTVLNLWYEVPDDHEVPLKNVVFLNNIFGAMQGGRCTDANNRGNEHPQFDNDLWYTTTSSGTIFEWWDGAQYNVNSFSAFQTASGQETNGLYGHPQLDGNYKPIDGASPAIDNAVEIPGINDDYNGAAPDIGAFEVGEPGGGTDTDGDGVIDDEDNCTLVANANQRDTNGDGFGNMCDGDLDNNGIVNTFDLAQFKSAFGTNNANADLDGNGIVNTFDLARFKSLFGLAPGPSGTSP